MPFQKYPNLATDGPNPFENLSEKLNQNRVDFFDGFLMGDFASGRKTDQTNGRSLADTLRVSQTKTDLDVSLNSHFGRMKNINPKSPSMLQSIYLIYRQSKRALLH